MVTYSLTTKYFKRLPNKLVEFVNVGGTVFVSIYGLSDEGKHRCRNLLR